MSRNRTWPTTVEHFYAARLREGAREQSTFVMCRRISAVIKALGEDVCAVGDPEALITAYNPELRSAKAYESSLRRWQVWRRGGRITTVERLDLDTFGCPDLAVWADVLAVKLSANTVRHYVRYVAKLIDWCAANGAPDIKTRPAAVLGGRGGPALYQRYEAAYALEFRNTSGKDVALGSLATMQNAHRQYAKSQRIPDYTALVAVKASKHHRAETMPISRRERWIILDACWDEWQYGATDKARAEGKAAYALTFLGIVAGLRIGSLYNFRPADIHLADRSDEAEEAAYYAELEDIYGLDESEDRDILLTVPDAKGWTRRESELVVPIAPALAEFFSDPDLFPPNQRVGFALLRQPSTASNDYSRYIRKHTGLKDVTPHRLRAMMITEHVEIYGRLDVAKRMVGHASVTTTEGYNHPEKLGRREPDLPYPAMDAPGEWGQIWLPDRFHAARAARVAARTNPRRELATVHHLNRRPA